MTDLKPIFDRLGISQYLDDFLAEGFESWETVLDITESDLDSLAVKRGHRRKLQREIAEWRGLSGDQSLPPLQSDGQTASRSPEAEERQYDVGTTPGVAPGNGGKRKYRRHPKPDINAPERPPSAYVIYSNKIRDDIKGSGRSFTEIAKLVGDSWQALSSEAKDPYQSRAAAAKQTYSAQMTEYKKTEFYREYMTYLADFKSKNSSIVSEGKRSKKESDLSTTSSGGSPRSTGTGRQGSRQPKAAGNSARRNERTTRSYSVNSGQRSPFSPTSTLSPGNTTPYERHGVSTSPYTRSMSPMESPILFSPTGHGYGEPMPTSSTRDVAVNEESLGVTGGGVSTAAPRFGHAQGLPPVTRSMFPSVTTDSPYSTTGGPVLHPRRLVGPSTTLRRDDTSSSSTSGYTSGSSGMQYSDSASSNASLYRNHSVPENLPPQMNISVPPLRTDLTQPQHYRKPGLPPPAPILPVQAPAPPNIFQLPRPGSSTSLSSAQDSSGQGSSSSGMLPYPAVRDPYRMSGISPPDQEVMRPADTPGTLRTTRSRPSRQSDEQEPRGTSPISALLEAGKNIAAREAKRPR